MKTCEDFFSKLQLFHNYMKLIFNSGLRKDSSHFNSCKKASSSYFIIFTSEFLLLIWVEKNVNCSSFEKSLSCQGYQTEKREETDTVHKISIYLITSKNNCQ